MRIRRRGLNFGSRIADCGLKIRKKEFMFFAFFNLKFETPACRQAGEI
jgi:hypothetical protein